MNKTSAIKSASINNSFEAFSENFKELFETLQIARNNSPSAPVDSVLARALAALSEANNIIADQSSRINALESLVVTDELTGILNRRGLFIEMEKELKRVARDLSRGGVFVAMDLDGFKQVNDQYGHPAGDACLIAAADYLYKTIRSTDLVARIGGDEFIIVLTNIDEIMGARRTQQIIEKMNQQACTWQECAITINASYGFVPYDKNSRNIDDLIKASDQLLYDMKQIRKTIPASALEQQRA